MDSHNVQQKLYNQHKTAAIGNHFWYKLKLYYNILLARLRDGAKTLSKTATSRGHYISRLAKANRIRM